MMAFAQRCDEVGYTVEYHPGKSATMTHLPNKKRKQKKSEPSSWDKLLTEDPLMRHESELADFIRTAFDEWPVDQREHFFKTIQWVLDELR